MSDFTNRAKIAQALKLVISTAGNGVKWTELSAPHKHALEMIMDSVACILTDDPNLKPNWYNIWFYAKEAENRCAHRPEDKIVYANVSDPKQCLWGPLNDNH